MKRQISDTYESGVFIIIVFVLLFIVQIFFYWLNSICKPEPVSFTPAPFLIFPGALLFYYIFVGRFSAIEIDEENLYYKSFFKKGQIPLKSLVAVYTDWLPYRSFFKHSYGITIRYHNIEGHSKTITFRSKEISMFDDPNKIAELIELKKIIKMNRNK